VLDVYRKEGNFDDQYGRSFSMNPDIVRRCGSAFIDAQQSNGVVATSKHFPGLGAASKNENTDLGVVTLNVPLKKLRTIDEEPFRGAIASGVSMIMPSWAVYPALDPDRPAGLSKKWILSELRKRLGFKGVTISDALEAGALEPYGSNATRAVMAVEAGMDIALASARDVSQGKSVLDALVAALRSGDISQREFATSTKRILALRKKL
jgi:beta-glucosidase-like glycosyl hydrolase